MVLPIIKVKRESMNHALPPVIVLIFLCFTSCKDTKRVSNLKFPELLYSESTLEIIDTLVLGENEYFDPSSAHLTYENKAGYHCFISRGGVVRVYNSSGERTFIFDKKSLENQYEFPNSLPVAYEFIPSENSMLLIFTAEPTIFKVDNTGKILKKIDLKFPDNLWFHKIPHLEFSQENNEIYLSIGDISGVTDSKSFFTKSPLIGVFDIDGTLKRKLGKFPKAYSKAGKFTATPFHFYRYAFIDQKHHFLFDHEPYIRVYQNEKDSSFLNVKASQRKYSFEPSTIPHYSDEIPKEATNDLNHFFTKEKSKNIYYLGYQRRLSIHANTNVFLMKVDLDSNTAVELDLTKIFGRSFHPKLSGVIKSDTLEFFLSSPFSDEVKIMKAIINE